MQNIEINFGVRPCIVTQNGEEKKALFPYVGKFCKACCSGFVYWRLS